MAKNKVPQVQRLSLNDYQKFKAQQAKKRWRFDYPLPVKIAIGLPLLFFIILFLSYIFYVKGL